MTAMRHWELKQFVQGHIAGQRQSQNLALHFREWDWIISTFPHYALPLKRLCLINDPWLAAAPPSLVWPAGGEQPNTFQREPIIRH